MNTHVMSMCWLLCFLNELSAFCHSCQRSAHLHVMPCAAHALFCVLTWPAAFTKKKTPQVPPFLMLSGTETVNARYKNFK